MRKNRLRVCTILFLIFLLTACHTAGEKPEEASNASGKKEASEAANAPDKDITIISRPEIELKETEKNAEQGVKLYLEDDTEVVGVQVAVTGEVILLSVCSVLGIIVAAVLFSCVSVAVKKPQEILSRMS